MVYASAIYNTRITEWIQKMAWKIFSAAPSKVMNLKIPIRPRKLNGLLAEAGPELEPASNKQEQRPLRINPPVEDHAMRRDFEGCAIWALHEEAVVALVAEEADVEVGVGRHVAGVEGLTHAVAEAGRR